MNAGDHELEGIRSDIDYSKLQKLNIYSNVTKTKALAEQIA